MADRALLPGVYCLAASAALTLIAYIMASAPVSATTASSNALIPAPGMRIGSWTGEALRCPADDVS